MGKQLTRITQLMKSCAQKHIWYTGSDVIGDPLLYCASTPRMISVYLDYKYALPELVKDRQDHQENPAGFVRIFLAY
jgi:hypothetical protein